MKQLEKIIKDGWSAVKPNFKDPEVRRIASPESPMAFDVIYNPDRDNRPGNKPSVQQNPGCVLCKNCVEDGPVLWSSEKYRAVPNAFPIIRNHTLLVLDKFCPEAARQGKLGVDDLQEALSYSEESGQMLIYNTFGAAATQPHQHFQGFDYDAPAGELRKITYSKDGRVQSMPDYPGANFVFYGRDKLPMVEGLLGKIHAEEYAYTLLIQGKQVVVIPRRQQGEIPACTDKRIGGLECSGGFVIGKIPQKDSVPEVPGEKVYFRLAYDDLKGALRDSMLSWSKVQGWYEPSKSTSHYFSASKELESVSVGGR